MAYYLIFKAPPNFHCKLYHLNKKVKPQIITSKINRQQNQPKT